MIRDSITAYKAVELLNEWLKVDTVAIRGLFDHSVFAQLNLGEDSDVHIDLIPSSNSPKEVFFVSMLGVVNGFFGADETGAPAIQSVRRKERLIRFALNPAWKGQKVNETDTEHSQDIEG